jgi:hypothetical protein
MRAHLMKADGRALTGDLPRGLASGEPGADDGHGVSMILARQDLLNA